jgi:transcriptional regulator with XRE-family HTH domain
MATGKRIKHYREKLEWTLQQLSDASDVDVGTISALEIRDSSRSKFFSAIAKAFGLTLEQMENEREDYPLSPPSQIPLKNAYQAEEKSTQAPPAAQESTTADRWTWPFKKVTREQFGLLDDEQRQDIEKYVLLHVKTREPPEKHEAPGTNTAKAHAA